jgi:hypothetical protein
MPYGITRNFFGLIQQNMPVTINPLSIIIQKTQICKSKYEYIHVCLLLTAGKQQADIRR